MQYMSKQPYFLVILLICMFIAEVVYSNAVVLTAFECTTSVML